jgi:hypothetical protein
MKIREKVRKIKEKYGKKKEKEEKEEQGWQHILKEPYYMTRSYRGLEVKKRVK